VEAGFASVRQNELLATDEGVAAAQTLAMPRLAP
jgi:hypothetical protein